MSRHFREEIAQGREVREEVAITIASAGEAVLFSGLCVVIGFAGLLLIGIPVTTSFDVGGMAVSPISGITGKIKLFLVMIVLRVFQKLPVTPPRIYQGAIHVSYTLEDVDYELSLSWLRGISVHILHYFL